MNETESRRRCDNGWRSVVRDYGAVGLLVGAIFYGGVQHNMLQAADRERAANNSAIAKLAQVQEQRSRELARVMEGLKLVQEQNRLIIQNMLGIQPK